MTRGTQPRPLRRARVTAIDFTCRPRADGNCITRTRISLYCGHIDRMTLDAFGRLGPWWVGQTRKCSRPHKAARRG